MMGHIWEKFLQSSPLQQLWYTVPLQKLDVNAHGLKCQHLQSAGSYRGKILGGVMTQLMLHAAAASYHGAIPPVVVNCDNNSVVFHGNNSTQPLPTNQSQADLLRIFKNLVSSQTFRVQYKYATSHADDKKKWQDCSLKERINIKVDTVIYVA